jgi:hypothetical protein
MAVIVGDISSTIQILLSPLSAVPPQFLALVMKRPSCRAGREQ